MVEQIQTEVSVEEVMQEIYTQNSGKSHELVVIHLRVLKEFKLKIVALPTLVYSPLLKKASVPEDWMVANITLIFIRLSRGHPGNYTLVSLILFLANW